MDKNVLSEEEKLDSVRGKLMDAYIKQGLREMYARKVSGGEVRNSSQGQGHHDRISQ